MNDQRNFLAPLGGTTERQHDDEPYSSPRPKFLALVVRPGSSGGHLIQFVAPSEITTGEIDWEEIALNEAQFLAHVRSFYRQSVEAQRETQRAASA